MSVSRPDFETQVRNLQIVVAALAFGVVTFGAVAIAVTGAELAIGDVGVMTIAGFVAAVVAAITSAGFKTVIDRTTRDASSARTLVSQYQLRTVVGAAILEGAAFLNLIVVMLEKSALPLIAVAALVVAMLLGLPTNARAAAWFAERLRTDGASDG